MHFTTTILTALSLATSALAALNSSTDYYLKTCLKPGQMNKSRYENLWLVATHTGAGMNDAVFYPNQSDAIRGFLNTTNITQSTGSPYYNQEFDLGSSFPWGMSIAEVNFYSAWEPVRIDAGYGGGGFFINSTGLQWSDSIPGAGFDSFGGWIVCDWWHGVPQLFSKWKYYQQSNPSSCADVDLIPVYV